MARSEAGVTPPADISFACEAIFSAICMAPPASIGRAAQSVQMPFKAAARLFAMAKKRFKSPRARLASGRESASVSDLV